jgi:DNA mismatch repair ATPase MutL
VAQDGQISSSSSSRQSPLSEHMVDDSPIDTMQNDSPQPTAVSPMAASRTEESQTATSPTAASPTAPSEPQSPQPGSEITRLASRATVTETLKGSATSRSREFTSTVQKSPSSKDRPTSATKNTNERTWRHPDQLANQWIWELLSCCVSLLCLVAIIAVLAVHHSRPLPQWSSLISFNSLIAMFTAIMRSSLIFPVAQDKPVIYPIITYANSQPSGKHQPSQIALVPSAVTLSDRIRTVR